MSESLDLDDPSAREAALRPVGAAYRHKGVTVGTDGAIGGTCKSDGDIVSAAFVSKDGCLQAKSVAMYESPSSIRSELTAIGMAFEDSPIDEDPPILTDSLRICSKALRGKIFHSDCIVTRSDSF